MKVMANRLIKVMAKLPQNTFVIGRQILDASLIVNEVVESLLKRKERRILCKLDIEKAYDIVNWNFFFLVLQKMGFGGKWLEWIKWCVTIASFSV